MRLLSRAGAEFSVLCGRTQDTGPRRCQFKRYATPLPSDGQATVAYALIARAARSPYIFLSLRVSFLPRLQVRSIPFERIVVQVEDAWVAGTLTAIIGARAHGRHGARIVVER